MTRTLAAKVIAGIHSQRWTLSGYGGTWAGAMRPLEEYVKRKVEKAVAAEREAIIQAMPGGHSVDPQWVCDMIRARGNK
jgi:hypothetical protein